MEAKQFTYLGILDLKKKKKKDFSLFFFFFLTSLCVEMTSQLMSAMLNSEFFLLPVGLLTKYWVCAVSLPLLTVPP